MQGVFVRVWRTFSLVLLQPEEVYEGQAQLQVVALGQLQDGCHVSEQELVRLSRDSLFRHKAATPIAKEEPPHGGCARLSNLGEVSGNDSPRIRKTHSGVFAANTTKVP